MKAEALRSIQRHVWSSLPLVVLVSALLLANACGGGKGNAPAMPGPTAGFAFIANSGSDTVL
jgi:hypothetical protein